MPKIEIDLSPGEDERFGEMVVEACARRMLATYVMGDGESDDERGYSVSTDLERRLRDSVLEVIREQAAAAAPGIVQTMLEQGVPETDAFGDRRYGGGTRSLKEEIAARVKGELQHSSGHRGESVLSLVLREEIRKELRGELNAAVAEARAVVVGAVREEASKSIASALQKALPELTF